MSRDTPFFFSKDGLADEGFTPAVFDQLRDSEKAAFYAAIRQAHTFLNRNNHGGRDIPVELRLYAGPPLSDEVRRRSDDYDFKEDGVVGILSIRFPNADEANYFLRHMHTRAKPAFAGKEIRPSTDVIAPSSTEGWVNIDLTHVVFTDTTHGPPRSNSGPDDAKPAKPPIEPERPPGGKWTDRGGDKGPRSDGPGGR